jgi:hypothetical protein
VTIANPQQKKDAEFLERVAPTPGEPVAYESTGVDVGTLSDSIMHNYFENYEIVSALAQKYGFKYFFFAPPIVSLGSKSLTREEEKMKYSLKSNGALDKLVTAVYQTIESKSSKYQNHYSMVDVFDNYDGLIWIDAGHVTPIGNQVIAKRMLDIIQARSSDQN